MSGGQGGTGFSTQAGTNAGQLQTAYTGAQNAMGNQNALLTALQGQNGLGNQSQVYNQLQNVAAGNGPSPAQAILNQATGQNVANQAALMSGQRGASQNVGLMARQNAQQGAQIQQQSAGQGATMAAQQALGALGQAGNMANTMASNQVGQTNAITQAAQGEQQALQSANSANNQVQGQLANTSLSGQQGMLGGLMGGAGSMMGMADGGAVQMTNLTPTSSDDQSAFSQPQSKFGQFLTGAAQADQQAPGSGAGQLQKGATQFGQGIGKLMQGSGGSGITAGGAADAGGGLGSLVDAGAMMAASKGGVVPARVSPGELILTPEEAKMVAEGRAKATKVGTKVPGKARVSGDSTANDTVPAKLPEGGVVVKRTKVNTDNPDKTSADFVRACISKKRKA